ncbi:MAG: VWA domain-containing protein [Terracidiphilus sp.]
MKLGFSAIALTALLGSSLSMMVLAQQQQPTVPDAPAPQAPKPLSDMNGPITPGKGEGDEPTGPTSSSNPSAQQQESSAPVKDTVQTTPPEQPAAGEGVDKIYRIVQNVTAIEVPVTVKDSKGKPVAGLSYRDFKVYENDTRQPISFFTTDSFPLSVAFVIDQSLTSDVMAKVNDSLGAIQGALTPYDEVAVFTYNNGSQERSAFTGAQSARLPAVLALAKVTGSEILVPSNEGPLSSACSATKNGGCVDPNLQSGGSAGNGIFTPTPKETHTLNDAILAAAKELSTRPKGRRRIVYVISDGKEYGSKAKFNEVRQYLLTNKTAVYGTLVGDSARWGEGYISHIHLPFTMYDNLLAKYILATGGEPDFERGVDGIEKSYAKIAEEARNQYTLVYYTHQPMIDGKFRKIDVRVDRPGMDVVAKQGYYPSGQDVK